ncbi:MAG: sugar phosphate isomerase/epimerase [Victivallales bacterium]|nr:sugar phosphate isomerase/epimerase [Victivallales bacterium]
MGKAPGHFSIACQTITWGDGQSQKLPEIFSAVADSGFRGVEVGWRHLQEVKPEDAKRMLDDAGLELCATHIGGNLTDTNQAKGEWTVLDGIIDYLGACQSKTLMFSGLNCHDKEQFDRELDLLVRISSRCAENGIKLLYHNHDWEFANGHFVFKRLLDEKICFCPDLGWIFKGAGDVIPVLEQMRPRIGAIHFKDFASAERKIDTVILGEGIVPLEECAGWILENISGTMWVIAEQDKSELPPAEASRANAGFLRKCLEKCPA